MITAILTLLGKFKYYLIAIFILIALYFYMTSMRATIEMQNQTIKQNEIDKQNIIEGYEATIIVREKLAGEKAITQEQKIEVIKTTSKLKEAVIKRGEIKQDEKSNFSIIEF